jgi:hypothetical protein
MDRHPHAAWNSAGYRFQPVRPASLAMLAGSSVAGLVHRFCCGSLVAWSGNGLALEPCEVLPLAHINQLWLAAPTAIIDVCTLVR